ncbi:NUMOD4 domain-containing protein [Streptomyces salinarius]|uniref:NUMOD4 domain-containing protein n=1 Tax=Streptomyces salinarius TaxID=2762598 RepID=UPI001647F5DD|nr:NUMOD4 domain-containing protein [Streptomyces salinarius]
MTEEWRKIPGYDTQYEVSNFGEVRSWGPVARGRKLTTRHDRDGFPTVRLWCADGKMRNRLIHLLVARAFPEEGS